MLLQDFVRAHYAKNHGQKGNVFEWGEEIEIMTCTRKSKTTRKQHVNEHAKEHVHEKVHQEGAQVVAQPHP